MKIELSEERKKKKERERLFGVFKGEIIEKACKKRKLECPYDEEELRIWARKNKKYKEVENELFSELARFPGNFEKWLTKKDKAVNDYLLRLKK